MKSGVSLQQMLTEVKRQSESKEDYLIAPNRLRMESYGKEKLKAAFNVDDAAIRDNQGAYKVTVSSSIISRITPCIYHDLRGQLWYIESPIEGLVLPELCLHFLIISALCNIMRYSPHNWSNILTNKVSPQYSLLISKYLRLFEIKYPMLVSELITNYVPVIAEK